MSHTRDVSWKEKPEFEYVTHLRIEEFSSRDGHRHARVDEGFRAGQRTCDPFNSVVWTFVMVYRRYVTNEQAQKWVPLRSDDKTVPEDAVRLVFGVRLISDEKTRVFAGVDDGVERLTQADHVCVNVDTAVLVEDFEAHDICFALPHLLFIKQVAIDHVLKIGGLFVIPQRIFPATANTSNGQRRT
jgi:hypothetical protein